MEELDEWEGHHLSGPFQGSGFGFPGSDFRVKGLGFRFDLIKAGWAPACLFLRIRV